MARSAGARLAMLAVLAALPRCSAIRDSFDADLDLVDVEQHRAGEDALEEFFDAVDTSSKNAQAPSRVDLSGAANRLKTQEIAEAQQKRWEALKEEHLKKQLQEEHEAEVRRLAARSRLSEAVSEGTASSDELKKLIAMCKELGVGEEDLKTAEEERLRAEEEELLHGTHQARPEDPSPRTDDSIEFNKIGNKAHQYHVGETVELNNPKMAGQWGGPWVYAKVAEVNGDGKTKGTVSVSYFYPSDHPSWDPRGSARTFLVPPDENKLRPENGAQTLIGFDTSLPDCRSLSDMAELPSEAQGFNPGDRVWYSGFEHAELVQKDVTLIRYDRTQNLWLAKADDMTRVVPVKPEELGAKETFHFMKKVRVKADGKEGRIIKWKLDESRQDGEWVVLLDSDQKDHFFRATSLEASDDESTPLAATAARDPADALVDASLAKLKSLLARKDLGEKHQDVESLKQAILFCYGSHITDAKYPAVGEAWKELKRLDTGAERELRSHPLVVAEAPPRSRPRHYVERNRHRDRRDQRQVGLEREARVAQEEEEVRQRALQILEDLLDKRQKGLKKEDLINDLKANIVSCNTLGLREDFYEPVKRAWKQLNKLNKREWTSLRQQLKLA